VVDVYDESYDDVDDDGDECQLYAGLLCYKYLGGRRVFVHSHEQQTDVESRLDGSSLKPGFQPTQRTQRYKERNERNEMTSLLDRPITAGSDDGICRWHAAKLWQTHAINYEII